jgi:hypothetical protein
MAKQPSKGRAEWTGPGGAVRRETEPHDVARENASKPMKQSDEPWKGPSEPDQKNQTKPDLEKWQESNTH